MSIEPPASPAAPQPRRPRPRRTRRRDGGDRRRAVSRAPAVALDLPSRRHRLRAMTTLSKAFAPTRRAVTSCAGRRSRTRCSRPTARANGCCALPTGRRSNASTSPRRTAARCASPRRSAARSIARSATPARSAWCAISTPAEIVGQVMVARDALGEWPSPQDDRQAHQYRADGHGRAALQLRQRREGAEDRHGRRGPVGVEAQDHACRPPASCR